ncbi:uncharacterized protein [Rutidosis leptorrhynchoides]|uniref:uncharacterized protein n=1 Tax=Rutidosis leptorrhynchoides TaxID=125765 RepID=UPI003A99DABB
MKLLKCFELCSGLKVNYKKSNLFGVGVDNNEVKFMADLFGCKVGFEIDGKGVYFSKSFTKLIGNGRGTLFCEDAWIKDIALKDVFKRLVRLETNTKATVADRVNWDGNWCSPTWEWSRVVTGRTIGELEELERLISTWKMASEKEDSWSWNLCGSGKFSTKSLTKQIMAKCLPPNASNLSTLKNDLVSIKVGVFVWRARKERLPVLFELDKRGVDLNSVLCPLCGDEVETVSHALFHCKMVREIWNKVFKWWGLDPAQHGIDNILCGKSQLSCSSEGENIWQATVWTSVYLIWKYRNLKIFKKVSWSPPVALNDIQVKSYE